MDMVDKDDDEDLISGYLNSVEKQYVEKVARATEEKKSIENEIEEEAKEERESEDDELEQDNASETKENSYAKLLGTSSIDNLILIQKLRAQLQEEVAIISDAIMSHPEVNLNRMKKLFTLLDTSASSIDYGLIFFNVQQIVTEALCVIFNDIIPNYRYWVLV